MESNERYYRRRAVQELAAARRAVTFSAWSRRRDLAETYLRRLTELTGVDLTRQLEAAAASLDVEESGASRWRDAPSPDTPAGLLLTPEFTRSVAGRTWIFE